VQDAASALLVAFVRFDTLTERGHSRKSSKSEIRNKIFVAGQKWLSCRMNQWTFLQPKPVREKYEGALSKTKTSSFKQATASSARKGTHSQPQLNATDGDERQQCQLESKNTLKSHISSNGSKPVGKLQNK